MMDGKRVLFLVLGIVLLGMFFGPASPAGASEVGLSKGQTVYVPAYSHIYHGDRNQPFNLTVTLSIRNTDPEHPISVIAVDYFDSEGKAVRNLQPAEVVLKPMGSKDYVVKESDTSGGSGANFVVRWKSGTKVTEPVIEAVMIGTQTQQGISFTSRGKVIREESN
ncbi:MAG: DUF3124 domain-containing protein [Syntrophobacteraceae bacterium]|nr:DUF3124 domain-containing protein [Desulfobacteraceae bacterium]